MNDLFAVVAVASTCTLFAPSVLAQQAEKPSIVDAKGAPVQAAVVLLKGRTLALTARSAATDGGVHAAVAWSSQPAGVVALDEGNGGRVLITALRDWFDENPRREPSAKVTACAGTACTAVTVTCLPDLAGTWPTKLEVGGLFGGSEVRNLVFVQDGRSVTFDPEPFNKPDADRIATLRLDGNVLRTVKKGNVLTRFEGALTDRESGSGTWASSWGFSGIWTAHKTR